MSDTSALARGLVALLFIALGATFIASTAVLVDEFRLPDAPLMVFAHSHLFYFFPVFGLLALAAFYVPCVILTDFCWRHVWGGKLIYLLGFLYVAALAFYFSWDFAHTAKRGVWEISPAALAQDATQPPVPVEGCVNAQNQTCSRRPILETLKDIRDKGLQRTQITDFARNCKVDELIEPPKTDLENRYCFPAGEALTAGECCKVQRQMRQHVASLATDAGSRSKSSQVEEYVTLAKSFFVIMLACVGILLLHWQKRLTSLYATHLESLERGVIVGAVAMLFWLLMDYGYQQTSDVLFGREYAGLPVRHSLVIFPWAALLIIYFVKRLGSPLYNYAQLSTIAASSVAVVKYELISNVSVRAFGSGAETAIFIVLGIIALFGLNLVYGPWKLPIPPRLRSNRMRDSGNS